MLIDSKPIKALKILVEYLRKNDENPFKYKKMVEGINSGGGTVKSTINNKCVSF